MKLSIYLTDKQRRALKIQAAYEDRGISEVLRDALQEYLAKHPKETKG